MLQMSLLLLTVLLLTNCSTTVIKTVEPPKYPFKLLANSPVLEATIVEYYAGGTREGRPEDHVVIPLDVYRDFVKLLKDRTIFYERQIKDYKKEVKDEKRD